MLNDRTEHPIMSSCAKLQFVAFYWNNRYGSGNPTLCSVSLAQRLETGKTNCLTESFLSFLSGHSQINFFSSSSVLLMLIWRSNRNSLSSGHLPGLHMALTAAAVPCSLSLSFNSPPHPASPLPLLPLPSSAFVCSPSAPRCFPARLHVPLSRGPLKLLFRSDSGTIRTASSGCDTPHTDQYTHLPHTVHILKCRHTALKCACMCTHTVLLQLSHSFSFIQQ